MNRNKPTKPTEPNETRRSDLEYLTLSRFVKVPNGSGHLFLFISWLVRSLGNISGSVKVKKGYNLIRVGSRVHGDLLRKEGRRTCSMLVQ